MTAMLLRIDPLDWIATEDGPELLALSPEAQVMCMHCAILRFAQAAVHGQSILTEGKGDIVEVWGDPADLTATVEIRTTKDFYLGHTVTVLRMLCDELTMAENRRDHRDDDGMDDPLDSLAFAAGYEAGYVDHKAKRRRKTTKRKARS